MEEQLYSMIFSGVIDYPKEKKCGRGKLKIQFKSVEENGRICAYNAFITCWSCAKNLAAWPPSICTW